LVKLDIVGVVEVMVVVVMIGVLALPIRLLYHVLIGTALLVASPVVADLETLAITDRAGGVNGLKITEEIVAPGWVQVILQIDDTPAQQVIYKWFVIASVTAVAFLLTRNLIGSRPRRAIIAIGDNETGAAASGVNLPLCKTLTFRLSAVVAGLSGVMWAMRTAFVGEQDLAFVNLAIPLLVGLVIGGVAMLEGALVGALVVVFAGELTKSLGLEILAQALFGVILILVTFSAPGGLVGLGRSVESEVVQVAPRPPAGNRSSPSAGADR
jgi:branched-chain amino acid transport system permease protein